ncbi:MAG: putative Carboxylesterase [Myxococcales bacterium]|nr:putative Carboxylesterase [Myxococcales bacterium]
MIEATLELAGLRTIAIGDPGGELAVVVLHGREMAGADLAPFARSLGVEAYYLFPDGPHAIEPRGRSWWPVDSEARLRRLASGPLELSAMDPPGRAEARASLARLIAGLSQRRVVLVGFSQGGMLAMDYVLHADSQPAALAVLSSTRIALADWQPRASRLQGLPVLVTHGRHDPELSFAAGELLRDFAIAGGASVSWLPFDGGHEIPLVVWRALRKLLRELTAT